MRSVVIHVCTTCRRADDASEPRPGTRLYAAVLAGLAGENSVAGLAGENSVAGLPGEPALSVQPVECLGNCRRGCTVALRTEGAWTYVFGDLDASSAPDLLAAARLMAESQDGLMPWRPRPEPFKRGMIARLPPLPFKDAAE